MVGLNPGGTCCGGSRASHVVLRLSGRSANGARRSALSAYSGGERDLVSVVRRRAHIVSHGDERAVTAVLRDQEGAELAPSRVFDFAEACALVRSFIGGEIRSCGPLVGRARADDGSRVFPDACPLFAVLPDGGERRDAKEGEAHRVVGLVVVQRVESAPGGEEASLQCELELGSRARYDGGARCPRHEDDRVVGAVVRG